MLIAKDSQNQMFNLMEDNYSAQEVRNLRYYCPTCQGELVFKHGQIKIPHFAHRSKCDCQGFSEGETAEHLRGKKIIYEWEKDKCQLEAPLKALQQRPDILYQQSLAIEFQCSSLPIRRLHERIEGYRKNGYLQWWILGGKLKSQKRLTSLTKNLCGFSKNLGFYFWTLDLEKRALCLHFHVQELWDGSQRWRTKVFTQENRELLELYQYFEKGNYHHGWLSEKGSCQAYKAKISEKLFRKDVKVLSVQEALYLQGSHLLALPLECYSISDFYLFFGDWVLFFRFLIFQALKEQRLDFKTFCREAYPYLTAFHYPLTNLKEVLYYFFMEAVQLFSEENGEKVTTDSFITLVPMSSVVR